MATPSRTAILGRIHKLLKKHFEPTSPSDDRQVLEQIVYALLLENARYAQADAAMARLRTEYFDWNEIRVATTRELAELFAELPARGAAATAVRSFLQAVFDSQYSFDLQPMCKLTVGQAQEKLQKLKGITPFALAYVTQASLDGHAIPLDRGALDSLMILGAITEDEAKKGLAPGLERAIPKNKGVEFGSLLHQLGAELVASPYSTNVHKLLLEIAPECKPRLPKRAAKKEEEPPPAKGAAGKPVPATDKSKGKAVESKGAAAKGSEAKPAETRTGESKPGAGKMPPAKTPLPKPAESRGKIAPAKTGGDAAKPPARPVKPAQSRPIRDQGAGKSKSGSDRDKSASAKVAKRKPR